MRCIGMLLKVDIINFTLQKLHAFLQDSMFSVYFFSVNNRIKSNENQLHQKRKCLLKKKQVYPTP